VTAHGRVADAQPRSDLPVVHAFGHQPEDLPFPAGEAGQLAGAFGLLPRAFPAPGQEGAQLPGGHEDLALGGPPYRVGRPDEVGDPLVFRGRILDGPSGRPVPTALVDLWQADAVGNYDIQDPGAPAFNLRGRLTARDGTFELRTVVPGAYEIPKNGAVGRLLKQIGRHAFRPRHIHFKISADGWQPLTTQIYFAGDQWIESDSIGAAKPGLVAPLNDREGVLVSEYTFRLTPRK